MRLSFTNIIVKTAGTRIFGLNRLLTDAIIIDLHCIANNKKLFHFAYIESYDPDGLHYLDIEFNDGCNYETTKGTKN